MARGIPRSYKDQTANIILNYIRQNPDTTLSDLDRDLDYVKDTIIQYMRLLKQEDLITPYQRLTDMRYNYYRVEELQ